MRQGTGFDGDAAGLDCVPAGTIPRASIVAGIRANLKRVEWYGLRNARVLPADRPMTGGVEVPA